MILTPSRKSGKLDPSESIPKTKEEKWGKLPAVNIRQGISCPTVPISLELKQRYLRKIGYDENSSFRFTTASNLMWILCPQHIFYSKCRLLSG